LADALDPSLFIGSSTEGLKYAKALQAELDRTCEPSIWTQGAFNSTASTLQSLLEKAANVDFAALILTPDDLVETRNTVKQAPRDNVIFELGIFLGSIGPERVFLIVPRDTPMGLPSDLAGINQLDFRSNRQDGNLHAAMGVVATKMEPIISRLGLLHPQEIPSMAEAIESYPRRNSLAEESAALEKELDAIVKAAEAQKWVIRTRSDTAFRLVAPDGARYSFPIGQPALTRNELRPFALQLKKAGLRISSLVTNAPA
jgi:hypothetical protein